MNIRIIEYRPPKIAQLFVLAALVLHWATPLSEAYIYSNKILGVILGAGGFGIMIWGWWLFRKNNTAICPTAKTDRLVTSGIYKFSRNPMYLGMVAMLLAVSISIGTIPFYLAAVAYFIIINNAFCPFEEDKLTDAFGEVYLSYKKEVRRWF